MDVVPRKCYAQLKNSVIITPFFARVLSNLTFWGWECLTSICPKNLNFLFLSTLVYELVVLYITLSDRVVGNIIVVPSYLSDYPCNQRRSPYSW